jgi:phosphatidylglycerophosphatase A
LLTLFVCFRFFDILKIYPANKIDQQKSKYWAVIGDDLVSGIYASAATFLLLHFIFPFPFKYLH